MTYTYVELEISAAAHAEISAKLRAAGYDHAFDGATIDMHGIALTPAPAGAVETIVTPEGQRLFKYPTQPQAFDVYRAGEQSVMEPSRFAKSIMEAGNPDRAPARPVITNIPALQGFTIADEPPVIDLPRFLKSVEGLAPPTPDGPQSVAIRPRAVPPPPLPTMVEKGGVARPYGILDGE